MSLLIVTSRYLKSGTAKTKSQRKNYTKYIATRETVEVREQKKYSTENQQKLLNDLLNDFPEAKKYLEYEDYKNISTPENASELISAIIERNADVIGNRQNFVGQSDEYKDPQLELLILKLKMQLDNTSGKKVYGYLKPEIKRNVDEIFKRISQHYDIAKLYEKWCELERQKYKAYLGRDKFGSNILVEFDSGQSKGKPYRVIRHTYCLC